MDRDEFLQALRRHLTGDVPPEVVEENVRYYRDYINGEVSKGRPEAEVIEEIGDPRLIAKNIEDTTDIGSGRAEGYERASGYAGDFTDTGGGYQEAGGNKQKGHGLDFSKWYVKVLVLLAVVVIVFAVLRIVGGVFTFLAPILIPAALIWLVVVLIRNANRR